MTNDDFAFLVGDWDSRQRRLVKVLAGCDEWYEFGATLSCQVLLNGNGVFDVLRSPERGLEGMTLRLFSEPEQVWRIWWASNNSGGRLDEPVVGRFEAGVGTFTCEDVYEGVPVLVRYQWHKAHADEPRWEQAFSTDGGQSWETNWVATFSRRRAG